MISMDPKAYCYSQRPLGLPLIRIKWRQSQREVRRRRIADLQNSRLQEHTLCHLGAVDIGIDWVSEACEVTLAICAGERKYVSMSTKKKPYGNSAEVIFQASTDL